MTQTVISLQCRRLCAFAASWWSCMKLHNIDQLNTHESQGRLLCMPADFCDGNSISCHTLISFCMSLSRHDPRTQRSHVLTYENNMLLWLGLAAKTPLHLLDQLIRGNIREVRHGVATMMGLKRKLRSEIRTADLQSWQ